MGSLKAANLGDREGRFKVWLLEYLGHKWYGNGVQNAKDAARQRMKDQKRAAKLAQKEREAKRGCLTMIQVFGLFDIFWVS